MSATLPIMAADGLTKTFGGLVAVDNVSFDVFPGEIFGLIGPNGAGKTTVFNLVTGLTPVTSGRLVYGSSEITGSKPHTIARLGIARTFQNIRLFGPMTALENVMTAQHVHTRSGLFSGVLGFPRDRREQRQVREEAHRLLEMVNLTHRAQAEARSLPYGEQRRLEIARALALKPKLLLLDEPGAGMNTNEKATLSDFIREMRGLFDLTIILIEHHVPMVMNLCDRIAVLNFGRLIAMGIPFVVQNDPAVIEAYLGD